MPKTKKLFFYLSFFSLFLIQFGCGGAKVASNVSALKIDYQVDNLREHATVYCPKNLEKNKKYPLVILLHGGFWGDDSATTRFGNKLVENGYCGIAPSYRGEKRKMDGKRSEGEIEYCGGEVEDVSTLIDEVKTMPQFDTHALSLVGFSHGGCIAMRVAEKRKDIKSVVLFAAPVDSVMLYDNVSKNWGGNFFFNGWLASKLRKSVGSTPDQNPNAWHERSPILYLDQFHSSLLFIHGLSDNIVPVESTYRLRDLLKQRGQKIIEKTYSKNGELIQGEEEIIQSSRKKFEFIFFEKQGHSFDKSIHALTEDLAMRFIEKQSD